MEPVPAPPPQAAPLSADPPRSRRGGRWLLWGALVGLIVVAQSALVWLTLSYEASRAQDLADSAAATGASEMRRQMQRAQQSVQSLLWSDPGLPQWRFDAQEMMRQRRELLRLERRDAGLALQLGMDSPLGAPLFNVIARRELEVETLAACANAVRGASPVFSRSYFVPQNGGLGLEVVDLCVPEARAGQVTGALVATFSLTTLLEETLRNAELRRHEFSLVEADGTRLVRSGAARGAGVYHATRLVELPGQSLQLRADAVEGRPGLIPNLAIALVLGMSLALLLVVALLARDMRRRAQVEQALAEALALRRAMEDSLVTGLRARDVHGRITYVNPAFCDMVGYSAPELVGCWPPPYWPPEQVEEYTRRQQDRLSRVDDSQTQREGFETQFMRRSGERFPVMIYEAPLFDRVGHHAGWMSAVLDVSAERRMEELSRQQQERLQASARLATVGEMASLLSHELNQPLAAIASYATGSLNLMAEPEPDTLALVRQAMERIAEQAERAGRVIKSVHGFVRRREQAREVVGADQLIESVLPLVRLQARKSGARIEVRIPRPVPRVVADRTMVEQVLLNLTRNGIQAMETTTPLARRVLVLEVSQAHPRWVRFAVIDAGQGIAPEVAAKLFTPFFTTRSEGMGLGLSLCRTVIEQHGGALDHGLPESVPGVEPDPACPGTEFRFTLPAPEPVRRPGAPGSVA
ncbi:two-component system sensor histidine kinase NtrB [Ideonella livida]|uniref:histidine kinase n=1 Tax=Ideonella livida TaxID=2707176 RepID=A0A7C9PIG6_9BURK|nr:ATP-binding protein [Ideonella livida]NDY91992.1 PAS domain S-box protein [Ideonella livida]